MESAEIKCRISELRGKFNRLKLICGLQHISKETFREYEREIKSLESKIKLKE